jgi:hypothetical protein
MEIQKTTPPRIELAEEAGPTGEAAIVQIEQSRAVQEAQAAFVVAKRFPRHELQAEDKIVEACKRVSLAEMAEYAYPRGGVQVTGPSIRLAEVMARLWGNMRYGFRELSQTGGVSEVQAYAADLETNALQERVFHVKHTRKAGGQLKQLSDPRDIYELIANQAARRVRACILALIPGDVQEKAIHTCRETLKGASDEPLKERVRKMLKAFEEHDVTEGMIEQRFGKKIGAIKEVDLLKLRQIFTSINDGMSAPGDWFNLDAGMASVKEKLKTRTQKAPAAPQTTEKPKPKAQATTTTENNGESRRGPISAQEDAEYQTTVQSMISRAAATGKSQDFIVRVMERLASSHGGANGPESIRNRAKREGFLHDLSDAIEQWEHAPEDKD